MGKIPRFDLIVGGGRTDGASKGNQRGGRDAVRVSCVGGGPAGLYFAIAMKLRDPAHDITIWERNMAGQTQGWGVVFWDDLLRRFHGTDPESAREIERAAFRWDGEVVDIEGQRVF